MSFVSLAFLFNSEGIGQRRRWRLTSIDGEQNSRVVCRLVGADFEVWAARCGRGEGHAEEGSSDESEVETHIEDTNARVIEAGKLCFVFEVFGCVCKDEDADVDVDTEKDGGWGFLCSL
jgi:hypothetical protein